MNGRVVTFEVDTTQLFDTLAKVGTFTPLGERLVGALLADPGAGDLLAMAVYGVILREER